MNFDGQAFRVLELTTVEAIFANWPFFLEGLEELNKLPREQDKLTPETLLKTVLHAAEGTAQGNGLVLLVTSSTGKPLFWGVGLNNTALFKKSSFVVFAVYSNKKAKGVVTFAMEYLERWAKARGYSQLQAFTPSFNGSRFRLFEDVWKFRRAAVLFIKDL